eukprot:gene11657-24415_t
MVIKSKAKDVKEKKVSIKPSSPPIVNFLLENYRVLGQITGGLVAVILAYIIWNSSKVAMKNLVNVDNDALSTVLLGKTPYVFFCQRGGKLEGIPTVLSELHGVLGSKVGFAIVNCSQILPSGKSMFERFKLKKEWRPTVFVTSPWSKPMQVLPTSFKDLATLRKSVETVITPKAPDVDNDKQLTKHCSKNSDSETCIVIMRGKRYTKEHAQMEEKLLLTYPYVPVASIKAQNKRLSFEDSLELPFDQFAMTLHALRNGTHYLSMVYPLSSDNIHTFVSNAISTSLDKYFTEKGQVIKLVKPATSAFKKRMPPQMPPNNNNNNDQPPQPEAAADSASEASKKKTEPELSPEEEEARRLQRERQRRDAMDKEQQEYLFQEGGGAGSTVQTEDVQEDVIEL